ncbi:MAG: FIST C-terminal domain-containing protein [Myxococcales bacterium]|nr:FIST C-terminal domain-containing protein [Myxococcales bacterium]
MASVSLESVRTTQLEPSEAAEHLLSQLQGQDPKLVCFFATRSVDQLAFNKALRAKLPQGTRLVGMTTGGEIDREGIHQGSVVLAAFSGDFEVGIGLGESLKENALHAGETAAKTACQELGVRQADLDLRRYVGMVVDDGFQQKKEELLLGILSKNQGTVLVGGGANDQHPIDGSAVIHADDKVTTNSALVVMFHTHAPWGALRSHAYTPTGQRLIITRTDETGKRALEIDGKPAAQRYAELLGVGVDDLEFGKPKGFADTTVALKVGREYFIRSPWMPLPDGSILFANYLEDDTELELMQLGSMPEATSRFFQEELPARVKNPRAALLFHCSGRYLIAQARDEVDALSKSFAAAPPSAGMNCHFELYCGFHINTTLTTLAFGSDG